jgi:uncharacterized membrane protein YsdA (DUF1294 family)
VYNTLFVIIILCIFVFSFLLFGIYIIEKKTRKKKKKEIENKTYRQMNRR